ncbi:site-2 protease family protein [Bordetella genomosp. 1]|uniref:Site-2 protease family protein n=1 Tax=Bordetella genomosp. 1 TaxID=1395607 RepID=A0ABX4EU89_9BORD|nr:site-2 protease family protein [Bordetella genomosp. 1]OZI57312.1 site-2 protease family protein [Bordetella genomosp. 1]
MMKLLLLLWSGLKFLKFGKLLTTGGTMLLSVAAYALVFGWRYAAGFVLLLFVHEMGHYVAARQRGLAVGAPAFIPFVGAWIQLKALPHDAETEAYVGLAGPLAGTVAALACYFAARDTGSDLLLALSYAGFFINLFNLIPISPLDGGRITAVLSPRVWLLGVPVLAALFFWSPSPILILVAVLALPSAARAFKYDPDLPENQAYYGTSLEHKLSYGTAYLGLVAFLAIMAHDVHDMLSHLRG